MVFSNKNPIPIFCSVISAIISLVAISKDGSNTIFLVSNNFFKLFVLLDVFKGTISGYFNISVISILFPKSSFLNELQANEHFSVAIFLLHNLLHFPLKENSQLKYLVHLILII